MKFSIGNYTLPLQDEIISPYTWSPPYMQALGEDKFATQCVKKNKATKTAIVKVMGRVLQSEVAVICSDNFQSITRDSVKDFHHYNNHYN